MMPKLKEDWLATIVGLLIVASVGLGLVGSGPQTVNIQADPGETTTQDIKAIGGWSVSATLADEAAPVTDAYTRLSYSTAYDYVCENGTVTASGEDMTLSIEESLVSITNNCDAVVKLTYKMGNAIPWPLFKWFE